MNKIPSLLSRCIVLTGLLGVTSAFANDLTNGLVSYWTMEAINGDNTVSDMSFANNLAAVGSPTIGPGTNGNAIVLNGTSQYLWNSHTTAGADTGLPIYSGNGYTVALWVKGAAQTARYLFAEGSTTSQNQLFLLQTGNTAGNNSKLDIFLRTDGGTAILNHVLSTAVVFNNTWHHIAWTDDNGACKLYVDGNLDSSFGYTNSQPLSLNTSTVGALVRAAVSGYFNGSIDDVAVWERVLTQSEVQQFRTNATPAPVPARVPFLTRQPASVTKNVGDWVLYSANAANNRSFTYQWYRNGSPIADATTSSYRVLDLTTNNSGEYYYVAVSNSVGGVLSSNAVITVVPDAVPALATGIISYWPLDVVTNDISSTNTPDLYSGNNMILAAMDASNLVPGQFGNALSFDGFVQYTSRSGGFPVYNNLNYSVSLWVKADGLSQNDRRVFSEGNSTNSNPLFTIGTESAGATQNASVHVRNDANATLMDRRRSTRVAFDNNWHHLVWTDANGKGKLYIDGHLDETDYTYNRSALTPDRTSLGAVLRSSPGNFYFGNIDEVATWGRVLSWTEIQMLFTNGVPAPEAAVAPSIVLQPVDQTNGVFAGDTVLMSVQATGTSPLSYQWRKNDVDISGISNPTALTNILALANAQPSDNGSYSVVISNSAGVRTSSVASLVVTPYTPATSGEVLRIDLDQNSTPNIAPGFTEFTLPQNGTNFNGVKLSISAIGTSLADRIRTTAPTVTNAPPLLTQAQVYNDFVFANNTSDGTGIRIQIERLAANTPYALTIWSFDPNSPSPRISDWNETSSGTPIPIQIGYTFDGSFPPTNDFNNVLGGIVTSSASGKLQIEGVRHGGTSFGVFFNGIRLVANPVPSSHIIGALPIAGNLYVQAVGDYPGQPLIFQESATLAPGSWMPVTSGGPILTNGMVVTAQFPLGNNQMFYRSVTPH